MRVLLLNQCFWPDLVATAQQLTDLAKGLAERGHEVTVVCSDRGYDNASLRFPRRERWNGIEIIRVRSIRADKNARWSRAINFASFMFACAARLALLPRQDAVVALTSPPLISWLALWLTRIRGGQMLFWVMDLNPDEAVAAGWLSATSFTARRLAAMLKNSMRRSEKIIALDRFMMQRIVAKGFAQEKIDVIPPWSYDDAVRWDEKGRENFRLAHNLSGQFVVMYAGNHSPCHPLDTLLTAAQKLKTRNGIAFCFVGGGSEQQRVREFARKNKLTNVVCLPYQPLAQLSRLLSAADLHVVVMGEEFPGIVHPSKIYNLLAIGAPFLYVGPMQSHLGDIITRIGNPNCAFQVNHGDSDKVADLILNLAERFKTEETTLPHTGFETTRLAQEFSRVASLPRLIANIEALGAREAAAVPNQLQSAYSQTLRSDN